MNKRSVRLGALLLLSTAALARGQGFAGGGTGLSILSGDARAVTAASAPPASSLYDAGKGPIVHGFAGWRFHDYAAVQGAYIWTRNRLTLTSIRGLSATERSFDGTQNQLGADFLLYFRNRASWVQPFLSVGLGVTKFSGGGLDATRPGLRVAAGVDVIIGRGVGFRYAFLETITGNPIGAQLNPPGKKGLMTFQNLFGLVARF